MTDAPIPAPGTKEAKLITSAEEWVAGFLKKWLQDPAFKAALHRQDHSGKGDDGGHDEIGALAEHD